LNIQQGGGKRIPAILEYLQSQNVGIIILTEFRENSTAQALRSGFGTSGLQDFAGTSLGSKINRVCIF